MKRPTASEMAAMLLTVCLLVTLTLTGLCSRESKSTGAFVLDSVTTTGTSRTGTDTSRMQYSGRKTDSTKRHDTLRRKKKKKASSGRQITLVRRHHLKEPL